MRIAVFHNLPSGGAKRALYELSIRLAARHTLDVFTISSAEHDFGDLRPVAARHEAAAFRAGRLLRSPFGRLNQVVRLLDLFRLRPVARRIAERIDRGAYDVAFVNPCRFENSPSVLRYLRSTPSVFFCQEPLRRLYEPMPGRPYDGQRPARDGLLERVDPLPAMYHGFLRRTDRANIRQATRVLVNSEHMRRSVDAIYSIRTHVNYLGVDTRFFRPLSLRRQPIAVSVGSLTPLKGFDFLVRSVAMIPAAGRPALLIASNFENAPERVYLEHLAGELGVELGLVGNVSDEELVMIYNQAVLTVYAPIREPFGLVPLESMACATPVVGVREGGVPETVVEGETGFLVERDEAEFARATIRLLSDSGLAERLGQRSRQIAAEKWTWEAAAGRLEFAFSSAVGRS